MPNHNVIDTEGRVWRRCAIPDGVTLKNGQTKEQIKEILRKKMERRKELERNAKAKARRKGKIKREQARKEWENRPHILYTPMGNKR